MTREAKPIFEFGEFVLDTTQGVLLRDGEAIALTLKAYEVLLLLVQNSGQVLDKEYFLKTIWPNLFIDESNLTQNIFRLRKILGEGEGGARYIETLPKRGYRFVAQVRVVGGNGAGAAAPRRVTGEQTAESREDAKPANRGMHSLAILPLNNMESSPETAYLADGISLSVINNLSQCRQIRVMAWNAVSRYKGKEADIFSAGREMGVQLALMGRLLLLDSKLVVRVELVDIDNGWQLWGGQYRRDFSDLLTLQEDIAWEISERVRLKLTGEQRPGQVKREAEEPEVQRLCAKGRFFLDKGTASSVQKALSCFEKAAELTPPSALPHAGMADYYCQLGDLDMVSPREAYSKAKAAAVKALELNEASPEAEAALAFLRMTYDRDWSGAERGFKQALARDPSCVTARCLFVKYLSRAGRFAEALSEAERALSQGPVSPGPLLALGETLYLARDYDAAIARLQEAAEITPDLGLAPFWAGLVYAQKGMYEEAIEHCQRCLDLSGTDTRAAAFLGCYYAAINRHERALDVIDELHETAKSRYVSPACVSVVHLGLGQNELAMKYLEKAYAERSALLTYLKVLPILDPLRPHPAFMNLLTRAGFAA